jgi:hypothetical protein
MSSEVRPEDVGLKSLESQHLVTASLVARDGSHRESNGRGSKGGSAERPDSLRNSMGQSQMGLMLAQRTAMLEVGGNLDSTSTHLRPAPPDLISSLADPGAPVAGSEVLTNRSRSLLGEQSQTNKGADPGTIARYERNGAASSQVVSDSSDQRSGGSRQRSGRRGEGGPRSRQARPSARQEGEMPKERKEEDIFL